MPGSEQRTKAFVKKPFPLALLLFSLIMASGAFSQLRTYVHQPKPVDLRFHSGIVESVHYTYARSGRLTGIHFSIYGAVPEFSYSEDFPSFRLATSCLMRGSLVTAGVAPPSPAVWQLSCGGKTLSDINSRSRSHREKAKRVGTIAMVSGLISLCWIWWARRAARLQEGP